MLDTTNNADVLDESVKKEVTLDKAFFKRADEHIDVANQQMTADVNSGKVSASMMFATARFNSWITAANSGNVITMLDNKDDAIEYFVKEYRQMLEQHMDEYCENFDKYMGKQRD